MNWSLNIKKFSLRLHLQFEAVSYDNRNTLWVNKKSKQLTQVENNPHRNHVVINEN